MQKRLEKINKHSDELVQFVNDLLDIARIESGRVSLHKAPLQIKNIAEEVVDMLAIQCKDKQIQILIQSEATPTVAVGDYGQIKRVFINLVNNAIKYTPAQGKIIIRIKEHTDNIKVDIEDNGCGIPEEAQDKLFVEFYRVDNTLNQTIKGTGLGLAMVKHIIEVHKGTLWLRSQPQVGSTFSFTIPKSE